MAVELDQFVQHEFNKIRNKFNSLGNSKGFFNQLKSFLIASEEIKISPALYKFSLDTIKTANFGKDNHKGSFETFTKKIKNNKAKAAFQKALSSKDGIVLASMADVALGIMKKNKMENIPSGSVKQKEILEGTTTTTLTVMVAVLFFYGLYKFITIKPNEKAAEEVSQEQNQIKKDIYNLYNHDDIISWNDTGMAIVEFIICYILILIIRKIMQGYVMNKIPKDKILLYNSLLVFCIVGIAVCIYKYFKILIHWVQHSSTFISKVRLLVTVLVSFVIIYQKFGKDFYQEYQVWVNLLKEEL